MSINSILTHPAPPPLGKCMICFSRNCLVDINNSARKKTIIIKHYFLSIPGDAQTLLVANGQIEMRRCIPSTSGVAPRDYCTSQEPLLCQTTA